MKSSHDIKAEFSPELQNPLICGAQNHLDKVLIRSPPKFSRMRMKLPEEVEKKKTI